jgi:hypothetical protein
MLLSIAPTKPSTGLDERLSLNGTNPNKSSQNRVSSLKTAILPDGTQKKLAEQTQLCPEP